MIYHFVDQITLFKIVDEIPEIVALSGFSSRAEGPLCEMLIFLVMGLDCSQPGFLWTGK